MAIRRAVFDRDVARWRTLISQVPNPPYYPDDAGLRGFFDDPDKSIFIDDAEGQMVVVTYLEQRQEVRLAWGLPLPVKIMDGIVSLKTTDTAMASLTGLRAVAHTANLDILDRFPAAIDFHYVGKFQIMRTDRTMVTTDGGRALCEAWKLYGFPTAHIVIDSNGQYSMWAPFRDVI